MATPANPTVSSSSGGAFGSASSTITTGTSDDNTNGGLFAGGASTSVEAEIQDSLQDISDLVDLAQSAASTATTKASEASTSAVSANSSKNAAASSASTADIKADEANAAADEAIAAADEAQSYVSATATNASTAQTAASNASASATLASGYAAQALTSETNAAISRDNAAGSASAAASSATSASTSATNSANSATASASSASASASSASSASSSASAASSSATDAETAQTAAETAQTAAEAAQTATQNIFDQFGDQYLGAHASDSAAATYASGEGYTLDAGDIYWNTTDSKLRFYNGTAWVAPETIATTAAANAETSEDNAADSAADAEKLAINPEDSLYTLSDGSTTGYSALHWGTKAIAAKTAAEAAQAAAETAESNASDSATAASTSETNASTSETNASTSATNASTSATNASNSATAAATSATNASTSETNAATSATSASNSATASANSATASANSATAAANSATNAETAYDNFDDRYLGPKSSDPALDNDGEALLTGAMYFDTTLNKMKVYSGTAWLVIPEVSGDIVVDSVQLTGGTGDQGLFSWNTEDETVDLIVSPNVTYQLGQELGVLARNLSGSTLSNGTVVKVTGASGNKITVELADSSTEYDSSSTFAVVTEEISDNSTGHITTNGLVRGLDTTAFTEGVAIWLDTNGNFTATKPLSPNHLVHIGWVVRSHATEGSILVRISNGWEIEELHDVLITDLTDNELLQWNSTTSVWENRTLSEAGIATAAQGTNADTAYSWGDHSTAGYGTTDEALALSIALG